VLRQEDDGTSPGFLIYMPVFEAAPEGRRLKGYIFSPFSASDFLVSALELENAEGYDVVLYDGPIGDTNFLARATSSPARGVAPLQARPCWRAWRSGRSRGR
jgi:CHASE1-domain containing sensor protein